MNRLTKEFNGEYYCKDADTIMFNNETDYNAIQKLGKLEDVMEHFMINSIEQLIDILKAWEVVKKFIIDSNGVYLLRLDSDDDYDNEYYQILKKALEVEDENNRTN